MLSIFQAQEQEGHHYYETAPLTITVTPGSSSGPQISFVGADGNAGYMLEMSPRGTLIKNQAFNQSVRVLVTDADLVSLMGTALIPTLIHECILSRHVSMCYDCWI